MQNTCPNYQFASSKQQRRHFSPITQPTPTCSPTRSLAGFQHHHRERSFSSHSRSSQSSDSLSTTASISPLSTIQFPLVMRPNICNASLCESKRKTMGIHRKSQYEGPPQGITPSAPLLPPRRDPNWVAHGLPYHHRVSISPGDRSVIPTTSPCSTCSSATPDLTKRPSNERWVASTKAPKCGDESTTEVNSPLSPSIMMTPSHYQLHAGCTPAHGRTFLMTDSQARTRHTPRPKCERSGRCRGSGHPQRGPLCCNNEQQTSKDEQIVVEASNENKVAVITPVKTGKKVQYRKTKVCPWNGHGRCVMGDKCNYAHAKTELRGRPDLEKTRLCPEGQSCTKPLCRFAHNVSQLRATGAFFRTKLCKFWIRGSCPSGDYCRHAHGEEQLRDPECTGIDESPKEALLLSELYAERGTADQEKVESSSNENGVVSSIRPSISSSSEAEQPSCLSTEESIEDDSVLTGFMIDKSSNDMLTGLSQEELTAMSDLLLGNDSHHFNNDTDPLMATSSTIDSTTLSLNDTTNHSGEMRRLVEALVHGTFDRVYHSTDEHLYNKPPSDISGFMKNTSDAPFNLNCFQHGEVANATPPLMFPSAAESSSAVDLKLNDILNIAVASQDPDLLECSAKLLRASLQFKKQQQQQQQFVKSQASSERSLFSRSPLAPLSTSPSAVSSPRLMNNASIQATLPFYGPQLFDNDGLWSTVGRDELK